MTRTKITPRDIENLMEVYLDPAHELEKEEIKEIDVPQDVIHEYQLSRVRKILEYTQNSPFWKKKNRRLGKIESFDDLENFPITTRSEINNLYKNNRWIDTLTGDITNVYKILTSSQTGTRPPFVSGMTRAEYSCYLTDLLRLFSANGIDSEEILLNVFPGKYMYPEWIVQTIYSPEFESGQYITNHVAGTMFHDAALRYGMRVFSAGLPTVAYKRSVEIAEKEKKRIVHIIKKAHPTIIATSPHFLINVVIPGLEEEGIDLQDSNVKALILGGGRVEPSLLKRLERKFNIYVVSWLESGELCSMGYTNKMRIHSYFNGFIPSQLLTLFEIVDEEGKHVEIGKRGRILATRLVTTLQPLIRYDTEDESRLVFQNNSIVFKEFSRSEMEVSW